MGITNLMPALRRATRQVYVNSFKERKIKRAAFDVSILIHQLSPYFGSNIEQFVYRKVETLRSVGVESVLVFDGATPEAKQKTKLKRLKRLQRALKKKEKATGKDESKPINASVTISDIQESLKRMCKLHGVSYVQSPYEADAQIAYMEKRGQIDVAVSTDTDYAVYGCEKVLFSLKGCTGDLYEKEDFGKVWDAPYNQDAFRAVCILLGCDYYPAGLMGFGPTRASQLYKRLVKSKEFNYHKMIKMLKQLRFEIPHDLESNFNQAWNTYKHQLVYDTETGKVVPFMEYDQGKSAKDYPYAGDPEKATGEYFQGEWTNNEWKIVGDGTGTKTFYCRDCKWTTSDYGAMKMHRKICHPIICDVCRKKFICKSKLKYHKRTHLQKKPFSCDLCDKAYYCITSLKYHKLAVHGNARFSCSDCNAVFLHPHRLTAHQKRVHCKERKFACERCGSSFKTKADLVEHLGVHVETKSYVCNQCGEAFKQKKVLMQHIRRIHSDKRPHKCTKCTESFRLISELHAHMRSHVDERPFKCPTCHTGFKKKTELKKHMSMHDSKKPFKCPDCGLGFKRSIFRDRHVTTVHSDEKPFQCSQCTLSFKLKHNLKRHVEEFHTELPFKCNQCKRSFKTQKDLDSHVNRTHSKERPYKCEHCSKAYTTKSLLNQHLRVHSDDNPFRCPHCGQNYTRPDNLKKHLEKCKKRK